MNMDLCGGEIPNYPLYIEWIFVKRSSSRGLV